MLVSEDFLDTLNELALGSRLKRLAERLQGQAAEIYQAYGLDIQAKWFTLLALLDQKDQVNIVEASNALGLSQPALTQFCKQLKAAKLVDILVDKQDSRKKIIQLTGLGKQSIADMKPIWRAVESAAIDLCEETDNQFYVSLLAFESALNRSSLIERTQFYVDKNIEKSELNAEAQTTKSKVNCVSAAKCAVSKTDTKLQFIKFCSDLAAYFETINRQWIEQMFVLEDIDRQVLKFPQKHIIETGGEVYFVKHPEFGIVGTCALLNKGQGNYELTKMGVSANMRGLKVGEQLLTYVIEQARLMNIKTLFLLTNSKCEAAIHLYEKNGFVHDKEIMQTYGMAYQRCNVAMRYTAWD